MYFHCCNVSCYYILKWQYAVMRAGLYDFRDGCWHIFVIKAVMAGHYIGFLLHLQSALPPVALAFLSRSMSWKFFSFYLQLPQKFSKYSKRFAPCERNVLEMLHMFWNLELDVLALVKGKLGNGARKPFWYTQPAFTSYIGKVSVLN